jgi:hypothetical protein
MKKRQTERRNILSKAEAWTILKPYMPAMVEDFRDAWLWVQAILDQDPDRRSTLDISTQAAMVFDRFKRLAALRFIGTSRCQLTTQGRMLRIILGGKLAIRFKKFDGQLHSGNVHTNAQSYMYFQFEFDGMESPTEVTFGYKTDATDRNVVGLYVTCPIGWDVNKWVIEIIEAESDSLPLFQPQPTQPHAPAATVPAFEIKTKKKGTAE